MSSKETVVNFELQFSIDGERWHFQGIYDTVQKAREMKSSILSDDSCQYRIVKVTTTTEIEVVK